MSPDNAPNYGQEEAAYGPRETLLSAVFAFAPPRVFNALEQAVERQGLTTLMSSAANGLLVARPRFSLLNLGRRVTVTFSPAGQDSTTVRARYTHGLVSFEDRYARLALLGGLFHSALLQLEAGSVAREAAKRMATSPAPPTAGDPAPPTSSPEADATPQAQPAYPSLGELRAKARIEELARRGLPTGTPGGEDLLAEPPEGFRRPDRLKARRIFWFALGVVLAVILSVLLSLGSR